MSRRPETEERWWFWDFLRSWYGVASLLILLVGGWWSWEVAKYEVAKARAVHQRLDEVAAQCAATAATLARDGRWKRDVGEPYSRCQPGPRECVWWRCEGRGQGKDGGCLSWEEDFTGECFPCPRRKAGP